MLMQTWKLAPALATGNRPRSPRYRRLWPPNRLAVVQGFEHGKLVAMLLNQVGEAVLRAVRVRCRRCPPGPVLECGKGGFHCFLHVRSVGFGDLADFLTGGGIDRCEGLAGFARDPAIVMRSFVAETAILLSLGDDITEAILAAPFLLNTSCLRHAVSYTRQQHVQLDGLQAMQTATNSTIHIDQAELPSMLATLCSYESRFGPYHPQTLCLMAHVAVAYWRAGETRQARPLLERVVRDVGRFLGRDHELRLRAIATLSNILVAESNYERAAEVQSELVKCRTQLLGSDHPETLATRGDLARILLRKTTGHPTRQV